MMYQSTTLCSTQARHYRDASVTFERRRATLASHIFRSRKSPNIWVNSMSLDLQIGQNRKTIAERRQFT